MRILIIEDESYAVGQLKTMLLECDDTVELLAVIDTVAKAVEYLRETLPPDLIFLDIHLADGLSLEIFRKVPVDIPVIFTTAFEEYSLQAFEINSLDYLVKPIKKDELQRAIQKYHRIEGKRSLLTDNTFSIIQQMLHKPSYRKYFLLPVKDHLVPIAAIDFSYFEARHGSVRGVAFDGRIFLMEENLEQLAESLDPNQFYRANRQYIVNRKSIQLVEFYFNGRLLLKMLPTSDENILVSKAKASEFKMWVSAV